MAIKKANAKQNNKQASDNSGKSTKVKRGNTADTDDTKKLDVKVLSENHAKLLQLTINEVPVSIVAIGPDKHFLNCNKAFFNLLGYSEKELKNKSIDEITFPEDVEICSATMGVLLAGELKDTIVQKRYVRKDGSTVWSEVHINLLRDDRNQPLYFLLIIIDITERKKVEDALKVSEQNLRNSMESSLIGIRIMGDGDSTLYANPALLDMFGYKNVEELKASPPQEHYTPESHAAFIERHEKFLRGETLPDQLEFDIIRKDGFIRHLQLFSKIVLWNGKQQHQFLYNDVTERKQAEDALKASEQNFRNSMDNTSIGIRISDNQDRTSYVNKALLDIFGYTNVDEVIANPPQTFYTQEAHAGWVKRHEKLLRGEPMPKQVDIDIMRKDGTIRHLDVSMKDVFWDGKQQNQTLYNDITERKQAEEAQKRSEQNFRSSMDTSSVGIRISDKDDNTLYVNQAMLDIFGYQNADEIKGNPPIKHYSPESYAGWVKRHEKLLRGEPMPKQVDIDIIRKDGTIRHLDVAMKDVFWDGKQQIQTLYTDITERKQAEEAQHESEEKYRLIVENSSDFIYTLNAKGEFIYISPSVKNMLGYNPTDLIGRPFKSLVHPDDLHVIDEEIRHHLESGVQSASGNEYRFRNAAGEWRWHFSRGTPMLAAGKKVFNFVGIANDITDLKRMEQETKQANERLTTIVKKLEEQQRQNTILTEMRDMLQACSKMEETAPIIMGSMKKLFPSSQGALFLLSNSRSDLESAVTWGNFPASSENNIFTPDACWGLRRGRAHVVEDANVGPICPHLINTLSAPYVCLPLMAKGDILGLLHLKNAFNANGSGKQEIPDLRQMAMTLSEYLSLSIANVKLSESLSRQSIQDPQSGLYNRRFMEESLQREITRAARKQTHIGVIMGDLDHFKKFNDVYGHAAGDKIIAQIGKLFNERFRGSDIACRYGGEEFLIILPESNMEDTLKRADALREEIKNMEMVFQGQILGTITMSMGIAAYPEKGTRMEELLRVSDTALYKAKQEGRDRVISG
jgi:diguanylate cyclase (GGDEF)-like protein/PAS domain S-box-containing protein